MNERNFDSVKIKEYKKVFCSTWYSKGSRYPYYIENEFGNEIKSFKTKKAMNKELKKYIIREMGEI
jgi:hypothetical protein